jgi:uncharacterized protein YigE (DUF2233 family)
MRALFPSVALSILTLLPLDIGDCQSSARVAPCGSTTCATFRVDLTKDEIQLLDRDSSGERFANIGAVNKWAARQGKTLRFATNSGIFDMRFMPLGLFIQQGRQIVPLNRSSGSGNFYLKPNGVFFITDRAARIVETSRYVESSAVSLATQSGPLLLVDGAINPSFNAQSKNTTIRSGVGITHGKESFPVFAISDSPISFYDFASFFKDKLECTDALYLDGYISQMFVPELGRLQQGGSYAAIFAVLEKHHNNEGNVNPKDTPSRP